MQIELLVYWIGASIRPLRALEIESWGRRCTEDDYDGIFNFVLKTIMTVI